MPVSLNLYLRWMLLTVLVQLVFRLAFTFYFYHDTIEPDLLWQSLWLGTRFDARLSAVLWLPALGLMALPKFGSALTRQQGLWRAYSWIVAVVLVLVYAVDWGHFSYLQKRLNANLIRLLGNPAEALGVVWQSYPVIRLLLAGSVVMWLLHSVFFAVYRQQMEGLNRSTLAQPRHRSKGQVFAKRAGWVLLAALVVIGPIFGRFNQYPLRWSDLYFTPKFFYVSVATNPVLNFFDTYRYAEKSESLPAQALTPHLELLREFLATPEASFTQTPLKDLDEAFTRVVNANKAGIATQPNVVLIYLESFSGYKTTTFGNPLNPTPFFNHLAQSGALFTHFYTAHAGTARGVFAGMTGLADVEVADTASRNPLYAKQNMLVNQLTGYERLYFIGGSLSWANVRGTLRNIHGLRTYEEENFATPRTDVWGLSDHDLFREANQVLAKEKRPFFAVIQTASNHRPYTVPASATDFVLAQLPLETLKQHGFESNEEFNGFRYLDYSLKKFFEMASQQPYFDNTVFVMMGDHGISGNTGAHMPKAYTQLDLAQVHTPLLLYAPKLIQPQTIAAITQQVDVLPTLMGRLNLGYRNTTIGRDGFGSYKQHYGFMINHGAGPELTVFDEQYLLRLNLATQQSTLHRYLDESQDIMADVSAKAPEVAQRMHAFALAYFHSSRFKLGHPSSSAP